MIVGKELSGKIWENGEFGVSVLRAVDVADGYVPPLSRRQVEDQKWIITLAKQHGIEETAWFLWQIRTGDVSSTEPESPFGLSNVFNSHNRKKRGALGITPYGRKLVRNACYRMEQECPKDRLSFLTLTLPNVSVQESIRIGSEWAEIIRVYVQRLKRHLVAAGLPGEIVGVTEIQMERLQNTGVFGLHFHCSFVGRKPWRSWGFSHEDARQYWKEALESRLDNPLDDYDWRGCENIQAVRKGVSNYLGKYISKGVRDMQSPLLKPYYEAFPSSWWNCSLSLRKRVHSRVVELSQSQCELLIRKCSCPNSEREFYYKNKIVVVDEGGWEVALGWCGQLKGSGKFQIAQESLLVWI